MAVKVTHAPSLEGQTRVAVALEQKNKILSVLAASQIASEKFQAITSGNTAAIDIFYNSLVLAATSKAEVDKLFVEWWRSQYKEGETSRVELLERWFGNVLDDSKIHGVKLPLFGTSNTAIGELTDDSVGLVCVPSTEATAGRDDFAHLPQFWCLEVSAEKATDGSHTIYSVEHIDDIDTVRSGEHLCWVLQKNTWTTEYDENGYRILKTRCHQATGWNQWPQGEDRTGTIHAYIGNPKYAAGLDSNGVITCGTNLAPVNYTSHTASVQKWRQRGSQYSGASGNLPKFLLRMMWLKYARKGNSGTIEGCSSYNYQYAAAVSETDVKRVILTVAQGNNLFVGSSVNIGVKDTTHDSIDRGYASMYSYAKNARISAITDITIDGTSYKAVYVDVNTAFDTGAGETYISTMPYWSGWNDSVQGTDGSRYNYTNGKETGLLQKIEFQNGMYLIASDELWQWGKDEDDNFTFDCYTCHDQSKVTTGGNISSDYTKQGDLTMTFPSTQGNGWIYIEDTAISEDPAVLWPKAVSSSAGSGTGVKAAFYANPASSGVRAAWLVAGLDGGGICGLACRASSVSVGNADWGGGPGSPGLAG